MAGITVDFNANLARFTKAIDKGVSDLNRFNSSAEQTSKKISNAFSTLGVGLSVAGVVAFGKGAIDAADRLNDLHATTALSVQTLASLSLIAEQNGSSLEGLSSSIAKLSKNIGQNEKSFKTLGVSAKDPLEAFKQLSDIFVKIEDPSKRAAFAAKALGKSWEDAAPILALGGDEIGRLIEKNAPLTKGLAESAKAADNFNDNLDVLKTGLRSAVAGAIPALSSGLDLVKNNTEELATVATVVASVFAGRATPAIIAYGQQLSATTVKSLANRSATIATAEAATFQHRALTAAFASQIAAGRASDAYTISLRAQIAASTAATIAARSQAASVGLATATLAAFGGVPGVIAAAVTALGLWAFTSSSAADDVSILAAENNKLANSFNNVTAAESAARNAQLRIALDKIGGSNPAGSKRIKELIDSGVKVIRSEADAQARIQAETDAALNFIDGSGGKSGAGKKDDTEKKRIDDLNKSNDEYVKGLQDKALTLGLTAEAVALYELSEKKLSATQRDAATAAIKSVSVQNEQAESARRFTEEQEKLNIALAEADASKMLEVQDILAGLYSEDESAALKYVEDFKLLTQYLQGSELDSAIKGLGEKFASSGGDIVSKNKTFAEEWAEGWTSATDSFSRSVGDAVASSILKQKNLADALRSTLDALAQAVISSLATLALQKVATSFAGILANKNGNAFNSSGVMPFAMGGVFNSPVLFNYGGGTGVMGEAGPEAIMPLKRGASGKLGVEVSGKSGGNIYNMPITINVPAGTGSASASQIAAMTGEAVRMAMKRNS